MKDPEGEVENDAHAFSPSELGERDLRRQLQDLNCRRLSIGLNATETRRYSALRRELARVQKESLR